MKKKGALGEELAEMEEELLETHVLIRIIYGLGIIALLLFIGTVFYMRFEGWSLVDSLYFSTQTITTVGYGSFTPTHDFSKLFTTAYMLIGVGSALYILSSIASAFLRKREMELLRAARAGKLDHIRRIHRQFRKTAGKLRYEKNDIHRFDNEK